MSTSYLEAIMKIVAEDRDLVVIADDDKFDHGERQTGLHVINLMRDDNDREICVVFGIEESKKPWQWQRFRDELSGMLEACDTYRLVASLAISPDKPHIRIDFCVVAFAVDRTLGRVYVLAKGLKDIGRMINNLEQQLEAAAERQINLEDQRGGRPTS